MYVCAPEGPPSQNIWSSRTSPPPHGTAWASGMVRCLGCRDEFRVQAWRAFFVYTHTHTHTFCNCPCVSYTFSRLKAYIRLNSHKYTLSFSGKRNNNKTRPLNHRLVLVPSLQLPPMLCNEWGGAWYCSYSDIQRQHALVQHTMSRPASGPSLLLWECPSPLEDRHS